MHETLFAQAIGWKKNSRAYLNLTGDLKISFQGGPEFSRRAEI